MATRTQTVNSHARTDARMNELESMLIGCFRHGEDGPDADLGGLLPVADWLEESGRDDEARDVRHLAARDLLHLAARGFGREGWHGLDRQGRWHNDGLLCLFRWDEQSVSINMKDDGKYLGGRGRLSLRYGGRELYSVCYDAEGDGDDDCWPADYATFLGLLRALILIAAAHRCGYSLFQLLACCAGGAS